VLFADERLQPSLMLENKAVINPSGTDSGALLDQGVYPKTYYGRNLRISLIS
jgi:hypothetical protein